MRKHLLKSPLLTNRYIYFALSTIALAVPLFIFYLILYKIYIGRINSFGCFDDCMNFGAAYFMLQGRELYSEIFFNHQPLMAHASYIVQALTHPASIFELLTRHTQALFIVGFISSLALIKRFGTGALLFVIFYETSKFYLFGNRFIAESFIVYPLVYMAGLIYYKYQKKKIYNLEYIISGLLTWIIVFSREPYIPLALASFALIIGRPNNTYKKISLILCIVLSLCTVLILPLNEYWYSIFTVSLSGQGAAEVQNISPLLKFLQVFFYPILVFFGGPWNEFRLLLAGSALVYIILFGRLVLQKKYTITLIIFILLALANIRPVAPSVIYYEAFHLIQWFGLLLIFTGLMLSDYMKESKKAYILVAVLIVTFLIYLFHPDTFLRKQSTPEAEFLTNYGETLEVGEVIKSLSTPDQTFYLDHGDHLNLGYIAAGRLSPYKYSWYVYIAPRFSRYTDARREMIQNNPPDFWYYGQSPPEELYTQIYKQGNPSPLFIKNTVLENISPEAWKKVESFGYEQPDHK